MQLYNALDNGFITVDNSNRGSLEVRPRGRAFF